MSQNKEILDHLKSGKTITPTEALDKFGCFRLGARIKNLRKKGETEGFDIITTIEWNAARTKRWAKYHYVESEPLPKPQKIKKVIA